MADADRSLGCPECGAENRPDARRCRECGEPLHETGITGKAPAPFSDEEDDQPMRPRKRRREEDDDDDEEQRPRRSRSRDDEEPKSGSDEYSAVAAIIPLGVSPWALAAFYLGLVGCIPGCGAPFALLGLIFGIVALVRRPKNSSYGAITGNFRAIIGIVCGAVGLAASLVFLVAQQGPLRW